MQKILPVLLAAFPFRFFSATQSARHRQPVFCFILGALMSFVLPSLFADTFTFTGAGQNYLVSAGVVQVSVKL